MKNDEAQSETFNEFLVSMLTKKSVDLFCISEFKNFNEKILFDNNYKLVDNVDLAKVKCYKKAGSEFVQTRLHDRYAFIEYQSKKILIVCLHAYDAINYEDAKRLLCMKDIKTEVDNLVKENADIKVFILGDFNCMPYDIPVVNEDVFNCVLYKELFQNHKSPNERYYNPMLLLLSEKEKVYGSFYSDAIKNKNLRWYLPDQLMLNKNADRVINYDSIEIITEVCGISLLKNNKPNKECYSDHLPLFFEIKED